MTHQPVQLTEAQRSQFQTDGFLVLESFLAPEWVDRIASRFDPLFATQFETGVYPDEWHGRPGLSQPNATRQMSGLWRCDRTVASFSFSAEIARLNATLAGWNGGRFAIDSCWIKPPDAPAVSFHRNNTYAACIAPSTMITCWIALSDAIATAGTLEVVPGSHQWHCEDQPRFLHALKDDYRQPLWQAAAAAGVAKPEIVAIELPPGGCVFVHGDLWHGSAGNTTTDRTRRSFAVSTFPADAAFRPPGDAYGYIFSRYRRMGTSEMDESFFPVLWIPDGYRSPMVTAYCGDALAVPAQSPPQVAIVS
ncbi:phytanoyl-CoA dioxygenase family protein [Stenomitos frigidus]|uniref:Phytanoyl-CoA dioxygenase family protein n=1 Tax=Stenomitos frigidus ULC18 TaxID=2107698 RepID=A0A2T1EI56_9CYAN|nr:phytanoyl-CoA dioxygenase family protein [Stenomitos frigidus]PSB32436.1 phytanoyl-CoA dioxygenase family protein [Stenomitos frigidus ULC18]